jgi:hypothetical protein
MIGKMHINIDAQKEVQYVIAVAVAGVLSDIDEIGKSKEKQIKSLIKNHLSLNAC